MALPLLLTSLTIGILFSIIVRSIGQTWKYSLIVGAICGVLYFLLVGYSFLKQDDGPKRH